MGALCYPEFVLKPDTTHAGAAAKRLQSWLAGCAGDRIMTNAFPVNGELGGHSLTWQCPPALDFPREAVECFQRRSGTAATG